MDSLQIVGGVTDVMKMHFPEPYPRVLPNKLLQRRNPWLALSAQVSSTQVVTDLEQIQRNIEIKLDRF